VQTNKDRVEIKVGIEVRDEETVTEIGVIITPIGMKKRVIRICMSLPMSVKSPRNLKVAVQKICSHAFSTKLKGQTKC